MRNARDARQKDDWTGKQEYVSEDDWDGTATRPDMISNDNQG
jgi:hypothetical protein